MTAPTSITLRTSSRELVVAFADGLVAAITFDQLRDASPAADGAPDAPSQGVMVESLEPVGNYAVRPLFSDGHASGIYTWDVLRRLAMESQQGGQGRAGDA